LILKIKKAARRPLFLFLLFRFILPHRKAATVGHSGLDAEPGKYPAVHGIPDEDNEKKPEKIHKTSLMVFSIYTEGRFYASPGKRRVDKMAVRLSKRVQMQGAGNPLE